MPIEDHDILNTTLSIANTWILIKLPYETESWLMQARTSVAINWRLGRKSKEFMTLKAGYVHVEDTSPRFIWVRSATAGVVVELEIWGRR